MADTPDWLQPADNDLELAKSGSITGTDVETPHSADFTQTTTSKKNENFSAKDTEEKPARSFTCICGTMMMMIVSMGFLGVFIFSAIMQNNDSDKILWLLFYSLSAAVVAIFILHYLCCFPPKCFYFLSAAMAVWSIVMIVITSLKFKDATDREYREELGYELGGTSLSLLSSLYHTMLMCCCVNKDKKEE